MHQSSPKTMGLIIPDLFKGTISRELSKFCILHKKRFAKVNFENTNFRRNMNVREIFLEGES